MSEELNNNTSETENQYDGILGDYKETAAEEASATVETGQKPPKKKGAGKGAAIAGICAAVIVLGGLGTLGIIKYRQNMPKTAASSAHAKITDRMAACYLQDTLDVYKNYYGEEALKQYFNLDLNLSLKTQDYQGQEGVTWFDNLMDTVETNAGQYLVLKEAGEAMGHKISADDQDIINDRLSEADYTQYGNRVTEKDLRQALELQAFGAGVYKDVYEGFTFTDEEIDSYIEQNGSSYTTCGLMGFNIPFTEEESTTEETTESEDENGEEEHKDVDKSTAATLARKLRGCTTAQKFEDQVMEILTEYEGISEEEAKQSVIPNLSYDKFAYSTGNELADWAFGEAKVGDTKLVEEENAFYVYLMTRSPSRDDAPTVNVRHILFSINDHLAVEESDATDDDRNAALEECRNLANQTLEEWKNGAATEESFGELASEKTEDPGSKDTGGLYENVTEGQMVQTFNDWCFDPSRQPGDTGIVETSYGVHVMYFSGTADPMWKVDAVSRMRNEKFEEWYAEQEKTYAVTINDEIFKGIDG